MMRGCFAVSSCFKPGRNRQATDTIEENCNRSAVSAFLVNLPANLRPTSRSKFARAYPLEP
jgi:hypothetical protein